MEKKRRYELLDAFRGFTILSMIGYHFSYDAFILYGLYPKWLSNPFGYVWQQSICISFILLSGFCISFSRNHWKKGILLNLCGFLITAVTVVATPSAAVYFGVLNLLGCSMLLMIPFKNLVNEKNWHIVGMGSLFLFFLFRHVTKGYLGMGEWVWITVPEVLYRSKIMIPFGFPHPGFYSSDYFPILPWFFLFFTGYCISYALKQSEKLGRLLTPKVPFLSTLGRYSLIIYMLHQPVLMLICILLF